MSNIFYILTDQGNNLSCWNMTLISPATKKALLSLGDKPYVLFMHYLEEVHKPNPNISMECTAGCLGYSIEQVKKAHTRLKDKGWFAIIDFKATRKGDHDINMIAIGYNSVAQLKGLPLKEEYQLIGVHIDSHTDDNESISG